MCTVLLLLYEKSHWYGYISIFSGILKTFVNPADFSEGESHSKRESTLTEKNLLVEKYIIVCKS